MSYQKAMLSYSLSRKNFLFLDYPKKTDTKSQSFMALFNSSDPQKKKTFIYVFIAFILFDMLLGLVVFIYFNKQNAPANLEPGIKTEKNQNQALKLKPVVESEFWEIAPEPDLSTEGLQPQNAQDLAPDLPPGRLQVNQPNDHTIFQSQDGQWHLWACVRRTKAGRVLVHWESKSLNKTNWKRSGEIIRAKKEAGESLVDWYNQEFIQSPYVVENHGTYFMFYGGYSTGHNPDSIPTTNYDETENQICLMTSPDGRSWQRYQNEFGYSRVFVGPGAARDPCIVKFGDLWYCYYCGHHDNNRRKGAIYVRTSKDLFSWSDWRIAHFDAESMTDTNEYLPESPFVIFKQGYYYLFRTHGPEGGNYVFRSKDPLNFKPDSPDVEFVTHLPALIAPEIIIDQHDKEYITTITDGNRYGIRIARLKWITDN